MIDIAQHHGPLMAQGVFKSADVVRQWLPFAQVNDLAMRARGHERVEAIGVQLALGIAMGRALRR